MTTPRVTIAIPTYQRRDLVGDAVASALSQTFRDLEVLVVDDGSTDGTLEALRERFGDDPRLVCLRQENGGTASARNHAIRAARGAYLALLDSDDLYLPEFLTRTVAALEASPDTDLALCDARYDGWKRGWETVFRKYRPPLSIQDMVDGGWAPVISMLIRTETARALLFDETAYVEDTEFLFRFYAAGHRCVVIPDVLAVYRRLPEAAEAGAAHKSVDKLRMRSEMLALQERYASFARDPVAHRSRLTRGWARWFVGSGRLREARPHLWAWWREQPLQLRAPMYLLRTLFPVSVQKRKVRVGRST